MRWLAVLAALTLAGCGDEVPRSEYDKRGNEVLAHMGPIIEADKEQIRAHPRDPAVYRRLAADLREFVTKLKAIGNPPRVLAARIDRIVDHFAKGADHFDDAADALAHGNIKGFRTETAAALSLINSAARTGVFG